MTDTHSSVLRANFAVNPVCVMRVFILALGGQLLASPPIAATERRLVTPLAHAHYSRASTSSEMSAFMDALAARYPALVSKEIIGQSVQGRDIEALRLRARGKGSTERLEVLVVGSQHGAAEPAGGEALLEIALDLASAKQNTLLRDLELILIPNANPDGRDLRRRSNANHVNLNTDFVLLSQPESRVLKTALARFAPQVVLDAHESAVLKRQSLARDGFLTDFDAQFEVGNNPAIPAAVRDFSRTELLPTLLARVTQSGLPAQRYIGEITSLKQPITNGGLTLRNFRNTAALSGAVSFLVETKLDSRTDTFKTYRNIAVRVDRQLKCIHAFLDLVHERRAEIAEHVRAARAVLHSEPLTLFAAYVEDATHPTVAIPLRRLATRKLENHEFRDHRKVIADQVMPYPPMLVIAAHTEVLRELLERHDINFWSVSQPLTAEVIASRFGPVSNAAARWENTQQTKASIDLSPHNLLIDLAQPNGRYAALLLDPRSTSSVFRTPEYAALLKPDEDFFIYRTFKGATRLAP
ncbi:MAG: DUF2817 domain-containing protein [Gammaproteobacteria bacterium]|nr:DUF2817 domain-containing protein [Gammaproteobacteria bacterium]